MQIRELNTIRGAAALIVVAAHYSNNMHLWDRFLGEGAGQIGVMIFFILSGFLMGHLYLLKSFTKSNVKKYVVARVARVIPLFIVILFLSYAMVKIKNHAVLYSIKDVPNLLAHLFLLKGESVLWTISVEVKFYLLFIAKWAINSKNKYFIFGLTLLFVILLSFISFPRPIGSFYGLPYDINLYKSLPFFLMGVLIGKYYHGIQNIVTLKSAWFLLSLILIFLLYPKVYNQINGSNHMMWNDLRVLFVISFVFFSILFLLPANNFLMVNFLGDFLGKISYSVYLWHFPILLQIKRLGFDSSGITLLLYFSLVIVVSYISYRVIEIPSSKYIYKWAYKKAN